MLEDEGDEQTADLVAGKRDHIGGFRLIGLRGLEPKTARRETGLFRVKGDSVSQVLPSGAVAYGWTCTFVLGRLMV